jgi:hypothetical protein
MLKYELLSLLQLQNLIKRDPSCYEEEFKQQLEHFNSNYEIFRLNPSSELEDLEASVAFLSHVQKFLIFYTAQLALLLFERYHIFIQIMKNVKDFH